MKGTVMARVEQEMRRIARWAGGRGREAREWRRKRTEGTKRGGREAVNEGSGDGKSGASDGEDN